MVVGYCVPGCEFKTNDVSEALAIALLTNHGFVHQTMPAQVPTMAKALNLIVLRSMWV